MGRMVEASVTPTIDTAAYGAGDRVGSVMTFRDVSSSPLEGGRVKGVKVYDAAVQKAALNLWLFKNSPTVASADNAALDISDANLVAADPIGFVAIAAADYVDTASNAVGFKYLAEPGLPFVTGPGSGTDVVGIIYGLLETTGTPTYGSASALTITLIVEHDD